VRKLGIDGDGQGDLGGHGGERRAVFVYQLDCYRYWERELGRDDFVYPQFGDNFTVEGLGDDEVCIGDRYQIGTAVFEVTQPRVTCYRVGIRMNDPRILALIVSHHRPGFYFRVLEEGEIQAGDEISKLASGPEQTKTSDPSSTSGAWEILDPSDAGVAVAEREREDPAESVETLVQGQPRVDLALHCPGLVTRCGHETP
jgi:MOSC domain-containing protein YiiM